MTWNWQRADWPEFTYDSKLLEPLERDFLRRSGEFVGAYKHVGEPDRSALRIELISDEALKTSQIEGEILDRESVQASLRRQFGLGGDVAGIPPAERGIAEMMADLYRTFDEALSDAALFRWHAMLMAGARGVGAIGAYRSHREPMQIVSQVAHEPRVHFEAPPSSAMRREMKAFIAWFNATAPEGEKPLPAVTRAGLAHLHFVSIHPFEDGNGRIGRAIAEKSLAQNLGQPSLIALAYTIARARKAYYGALERSSTTNEITDWLLWFGKTVLDAQDNTNRRVDFYVAKAKFYETYGSKLNARQQKAVARMFEEGIDGFKGGLSAEKYIGITKASRATATRDLQELVELGVLKKTGELRYTRYWLNLPMKASGAA